MIYQLIDARLNDSTLLFDEDINPYKKLKTLLFITAGRFTYTINWRRK